jgi:hypothetical protein
MLCLCAAHWRTAKCAHCVAHRNVRHTSLLMTASVQSECRLEIVPGPLRQSFPGRLRVRLKFTVTVTAAPAAKSFPVESFAATGSEIIIKLTGRSPCHDWDRERYRRFAKQSSLG